VSAEQPFPFLIHDRDTKFGRAFEIRVVTAPGSATRLNMPTATRSADGIARNA
jgi:hypothetical protein